MRWVIGVSQLAICFSIVRPKLYCTFQSFYGLIAVFGWNSFEIFCRKIVVSVRCIWISSFRAVFLLHGASVQHSVQEGWPEESRELVWQALSTFRRSLP